MKETLFSLPLDIVMLLFAAFLVFLYSITFTAKHSYQMLLSLYVARAGFEMSRGMFADTLARIEGDTRFLLEIGVISLFAVFVYWTLSSVLGSGGERKRLSWIGATALNLLIFGFTIATVLSVWTGELFHLSDPVKLLFLSGSAQFLWFWVPLLFLLFLRFKNRLL